MKDAAVGIPVDAVSCISPEESVLPGKALIVDLCQGFCPYGFGRFSRGEPGAMGSAEYG
jgi:hypothetical protein